MARKKIVIVQYSGNPSGSTYSALSIMKAFVHANWEVHVAFGFKGPMTAEFERHGATTTIIFHQNWLRRDSVFHFTKDFVSMLRQSFKFSKYFRIEKPDLVYVNTLVSSAAVLAAKKSGIKIIWHIRELFSDAGGEMKAPTLLRGIISSWIPSSAAQIIIPSRIVAKNVLRDKTKNLTIIPNAISSTFFKREDKLSARNRLGVPLDKTIIGIPGTLRPVKGHPFFIRSTKEWLKQHSDIIVLVSGAIENHYAKRLIHKIELEGLRQQFLFLGNVKDMRLFYSSCDFVCVPSVSESFGRTIIESFACSTPVIATRVGGIPEIIAHEKNGLLVEYGNQNELVQAVQRLLTDAPLAERLAKQAYLNAKEHYTEEKYQRGILDIANQLV